MNYAPSNRSNNVAAFPRNVSVAAHVDDVLLRGRVPACGRFGVVFCFYGAVVRQFGPPEAWLKSDKGRANSESEGRGGERGEGRQKDCG